MSLPLCSREPRSHAPVQADRLAGPKSQEGPNRARCCHGNPDLEIYFRRKKKKTFDDLLDKRKQATGLYMQSDPEFVFKSTKRSLVG